MVVTVTSNEGVAVVTVDNPPVNATSQTVRQGLLDAHRQIEADNAIKAAVLICAGPTFIAGADIKEFGARPIAPHLPDLVTELESGTKPWVAAIHGTALGGGLEVALGCSYRIATATAKMGLPEVTLGLIPGAGGTVRLTRLIGAEPALDMMASGKPISADRAQQLGLIDEISDRDLLDDAIAFANRIAGQPRPTPILTRTSAHDPDALDTKISTIAAKARGQKSPNAVCQAVRNAIELPAQDALAAERDLFLSLKSDPQSQALRHIFFAERATTKIDMIKDVTARPITQVGVIGGGTMGAGIAAACLLAGLDVVMIERDDAALENGMARCTDILASSLKRALVSQIKHDEMVIAFSGASEYAALAQADIVIEAVFEDMGAKKSVFLSLIHI